MCPVSYCNILIHFSINITYFDVHQGSPGYLRRPPWQRPSCGDSAHLAASFAAQARPEAKDPGQVPKTLGDSLMLDV